MSSKTTQAPQRPLSPHLQVYRLPYNALMSIIGRGVGIGLSVATSILFIWFIAAAWVPAVYESTVSFLAIPFVKYPLLLATFAIFFYVGNGIRHVIWNFAVGVDIVTGKKTGNITLIVSAVLTLFVIGLFAFSGSASAHTSIETIVGYTL